MKKSGSNYSFSFKKEGKRGFQTGNCECALTSLSEEKTGKVHEIQWRFRQKMIVILQKINGSSCATDDIVLFKKKIERKRLFCLWETCAVRELRPLLLPLLFWEACWQPKGERTILKGGKGREITLFRLREKKRENAFFSCRPRDLFS